MRLVKKFERDDRTELVSRIFDKVITQTDCHLPFGCIEFHVRDSDVSIIEDGTAVICVNYNNPLVLEKDQKGIDILLRHELFRLMFKMSLPRMVEDVIVAREMIKRGYGNDIFYMYYNYAMKTRVNSAEDYMKVNLPWIIFHGYDKHDSEFLKALAKKLCKKKFPETKKFVDLLCNLSPKNLSEAVKECEGLVH